MSDTDNELVGCVNYNLNRSDEGSGVRVLLELPPVTDRQVRGTTDGKCKSGESQTTLGR